MTRDVCSQCNGTGEVPSGLVISGIPLMEYCWCQSGIDKAHADYDAVDPADCTPFTKTELDSMVNRALRMN